MPIYKTKYTPDAVERILNALRSGNYRETAARFGGIDKLTFARWMNDLPEFAEAVLEAEAAAEIRKVARIERAAEKNWTADAWWLERRFPERWGRVDRVEIYQVEQQAKALADELRSEGIEITAEEIIKERAALVKRAGVKGALPAPREAKSA